MADLDIAERRVPAGRARRARDRRPPRRPARRDAALVHGEAIVIRILDKSASSLDLDKLGMRRARRTCASASAFRQAYGAVLVTGPTGLGQVHVAVRGARRAQHAGRRTSSRSRTRSSTSSRGSPRSRSTPRRGSPSPTALRSMMRADPDVIMVGEIRDRETAQIAIEAALTGHLVLSTLHTNDAPTAITRLVEMGVEPFLVASAIDCVVAQRLCADAVPELQARDDPDRGRPARERLPLDGGPRGLRAGGLRSLRHGGYKGRHRPLRGHDARRRDPGACIERSPASRIARGRDQRRDAPAARRRPGEGRARASPRSPRWHASPASAQPSTSRPSPPRRASPSPRR